MNRVGDVTRRVGDVMNRMGDVMNCMGDVMNRVGDVTRRVGDVMNRMGDVMNCMGDVMNRVGDVMNRMGDVMNHVSTTAVFLHAKIISVTVKTSPVIILIFCRLICFFSHIFFAISQLFQAGALKGRKLRVTELQPCLAVSCFTGSACTMLLCQFQPCQVFFTR